MVLSGIVAARIVDVRFYTSGRILRVNKNFGSAVRTGDVIASLDRKILQAQLDKQLADYEKARADFEIFSAKNPEPLAATEKFLKSEKQAALNSSVKEVEISKTVLDYCDLLSPVDGVVQDDGNIVPGINVTPAASAYKIIDSSSYYLKCTVLQKDVTDFKDPREVRVSIDGFNGSIVSRATLPYSDGKEIFINIALSVFPGLLIGMTGHAEY